MKSESSSLYFIFTFQTIGCFFLSISMVRWMLSAEKRKETGTRWSIFKFVLFAFLAKWTYDTYALVQIDIEENQDGGFDPYAILQITNDGSFGTRAIKKKYREMSLKWHPDKVDLSEIDEKVARRRYEGLVKAYKTLTDNKMYDNWIKYGNPDGSPAVMAMGFALPQWMLEEENRVYLLGGIFVGCATIVLSLVTVMNVNNTHCKNGVMVASKDNMTDMIVAILDENKGNVRIRGFKDDDIIEIFEQSMEVMDLNEKWNKKHDFRDVVSAMASIKKNKSVDKGRNKGKGKNKVEEKVEEKKVEEEKEESPAEPEDNTPPEQKVLELLPKLVEVIIEIVMEISSERDENGEQLYRFNKEAFFNAFNRLMTQIEVFKVEARSERRNISIKCDVEGQATRFCMGDLLSVNAKVERVPENTLERRLWIVCIAQISGKAVIQEFVQKKDVEEVTFKTMLMKPGKESFKILVLDGYSEVTQSLAKNIIVIDTGNYHGFQANDLPDMDAPGED